MGIQYSCQNEGRRLLVIDSGTINGIDYLEVVSEDQTTLEVHFLHPLPGETGGVPAPGDPLAPDNIRIEGGVRVTDFEVQTASADQEVLTVTVDHAGDFSTYTLRIVASATDDDPPAGFDPLLSAVSFSFKANCPSDFDCQEEEYCPPEVRDEPPIDYLAKDFSSFRRLMLDRLSLLMPEWKERNIADLQIALVELLAYAGDHLSYYQDAVATEAYLFRARKRVSIRRHARLLDYHMHHGCNARVWVHLAVEAGGAQDGGTLSKGTRLLTRGRDGEVIVSSQDLDQRLAQQDPTVFETKHDIALYSDHNEIAFYTWGNDACCLPAGATRATLLQPATGALAEGQVLIFEEIKSPTTGSNSDADRQHRHAVRLTRVSPKTDLLTGEAIVDIAWDEEDALPFPLCISAKIEGDIEEKISVARGNIVLADHGRTLSGQDLYPAAAVAGESYRPGLLHREVTVSEPYQHEQAEQQPAANMLAQDPQRAIPDILLREGDQSWIAQRDLLGSDRFARDFVAEIETDQSVQLRFGDDILGREPGEGFEPQATYRLGNGIGGNVGAEAIGRIVLDGAGILQVRNPLPARGGTAPESAEAVRQYAPEAFKTQERAVTAADYAKKTELHPEVQRAVAEFRWTGSWHTVFLTIDRLSGLPVQDAFKDEIRLHLEKYRMAGYDLEVRPPRFVPLEIEMNVCVKSDYFRALIKEKLLTVFSRFDLPDGTRGFFHPDRFTFGQPLYLSALYEAAMALDGIESVEVKTFKRLRRQADKEKENGLLEAGATEILRLDNDPNFPENGKIDFIMFGGL